MSDPSSWLWQDTDVLQLLCPQPEYNSANCNQSAWKKKMFFVVVCSKGSAADGPSPSQEWFLHHEWTCQKRYGLRS